MDITAIRAFRDNYIWLLREDGHAAVVDPGDARPVLEALRREQLRLSAILITHHHADHTGGVAQLLAHVPVPVFGPAGEDIVGVTVRLREPERIRVPGIGLDLDILDVPGHTRGHIAYRGPGIVFCGDTLFGCGCGRLFEGTAEQMWNSLAKLRALPPDTRAYCAHEYTQANIDFALAVEPGNPDLLARADRVDRQRELGEATVPLSMAEELLTNPFLRCDREEVAAAAGVHQGAPLRQPSEVFAAVRKWKDGFPG